MYRKTLKTKTSMLVYVQIVAKVHLAGFYLILSPIGKDLENK